MVLGRDDGEDAGPAAEFAGAGAVRITHSGQVEGSHGSAGGLVDVRASLAGVLLPDGLPRQGQDVVAGHGRGSRQGRAQPRPRSGIPLLPSTRILGKASRSTKRLTITWKSTRPLLAPTWSNPAAKGQPRARPRNKGW